MAQRTVITVTCDLPHDETQGDVEATETISLALGNTTREIDVCEPHAADVREVFGQYMAYGRPVAAPRNRKSSGGRDRQRSGDIRAWAKGRGRQVSDRGRIPGAVVDEYNALAS